MDIEVNGIRLLSAIGMRMEFEFEHDLDADLSFHIEAVFCTGFLHLGRG